MEPALKNALAKIMELLESTQEHLQRHEYAAQSVQRELIVLSERLKAVGDRSAQLTPERPEYSDYTQDELATAHSFNRNEMCLAAKLVGRVSFEDLMAEFKLNKNGMYARIWRLCKKLNCKNEEHLRMKLRNMAVNDELLQLNVKRYGEVSSEPETPESG